MGLCHEFGSQIRAGCDHPMRAGASACSCAECGVVCRGLFDGCPDVWARGPRPVSIAATRASASNGAPVALTAGPSLRPEGPRSVRIVDAPAAIGPAPRDRGAADQRRGDPGPGDRAQPQSDPGDRSSSGDDRSASTAGGGDSLGDPRREVFKWFEEAFEGVRGELQALVGAMTHQQAMLAELLDSRQAELRLALVAESLPDIVADAVRTAMDEHTSALAKSSDRSHERFRTDVEQIKVDTAASVESLNHSFQKLTDAIAVHDEEAEQRESVRLGTLKGSVTRQITPLADALAALGAKIDALADEVGASARPTPPAAAPRRPAPSVPAAREPVAREPAARGPAAREPARPPAGPVRGTAARPPAARAAAPRASAARAPAPASAAPSQPALPKRVATGRTGARTAPPAAGTLVSTARMQRPDPADDVEADEELQARTAPVARVRLGATSPPAPHANGTTTPPAVRRPPTARVSAARATDAAEPTNGPEQARVPRVITRRNPVVRAAPLPDEPVVVYELETADDEEATWAPPAWVSAAARRPLPARSAPTGPAPEPPATRSAIAKAVGKARAARPTRTPT